MTHIPFFGPPRMFIIGVDEPKKFFLLDKSHTRSGGAGGAARLTASEGCDGRDGGSDMEMVAGQGTFMTDTGDVTVKEVRASCPRVVKSLVCVSLQGNGSVAESADLTTGTPWY